MHASIATEPYVLYIYDWWRSKQTWLRYEENENDEDNDNTPVSDDNTFASAPAPVLTTIAKDDDNTFLIWTLTN